MFSVFAAKPSMKIFSRPKVTAFNFFAKRSLKNSLILGLVLIVYLYTKVYSFVKDYPTAAARAKLTHSLASNVGIEALLGIGHKINTVGGFAVWNFLCLVVAAGAIWAIIHTTKTIRGEEESGRAELFLAGQTSGGKYALSLIKALGVGLLLLYVLISVGVLVVGHLPGSGFTTSSALFFALALSLGAIEFMAVGALASQLMPTRSRALGLSVVVFAVFYLVRAMADTTSAHWLLNLSPLGWIEKLAPMYGSDPVWLVPIFSFIAVLIAASLFSARNRDLDDAVFADKDSAKAHYSLLNSPFGLAFRMNRFVSFGWVAALALTAFLYSLLAKGAVESLTKSAGVKHSLKRLAVASSGNLTTIFMGIVFLLVMLVAMFYAANAVGRIRSDEARGYLDNFLVRPVSRSRWLIGRVLLIVLVVLTACVSIGVFAWLGQASQHTGIALNAIAKASLNAVVPTIFVLASGIFIFGLLPRLTSSVAYIVVGWSFLITMLSSGLNLNHWLLDTSLLHQIALAPAVSVNWTVDLAMVAASIGLILFGMVGFNRRDIQGE